MNIAENVLGFCRTKKKKKKKKKMDVIEIILG
jgi:hypothetical protein